MEIYDLIIIGSGPAGLTAAIYATRANLKTLVVAGGKWGGQLMLTSVIENFPGFPEGIMGPQLMANMRKQAEKFGAVIKDEDFEGADFTKRPIAIKTIANTYFAKTVIIATGADTLWLGVTGEKEKIGKGVSSCATCDAAFFRNREVVVVGGGDSAMEEALFLTKFASKVTLIHRRDQFKASKIMTDRVLKDPKIEVVLNTQVVEILGNQTVEGVRVLNKDGQQSEIKTAGVFVAIGHMPNSKLFKGIELDEKGFVKKFEHSKTNIEGVFVAGDVHDFEYKQAITAAGYGCAAALEAEKYLEGQKT